MKKEKSPLAEFMAERREELGYNQLTLQEKSGVSAGTIASIESGLSKAPKAATLRKLAHGLQVTYEELDCIVRGVAYEPDLRDFNPVRDFESYLINHDTMPSDVAESVIEMVRAVLKRYD